jgi:ferric-dicitrate binding protein FerR (iron transport regulator)
MDKEKLIKYLNNACSEQEFEEIADWIRDNALSKGSRERAFKDWKSFMPTDAKNEKKYQALLDRIHHEINLKQNIKQTTKRMVFSQSLSWLSKAAAILFIPLLGILLYVISERKVQNNILVENLTDTVEIIAPVGSRSVVQLTDGTEVHLNYASKIKYPRVFRGNTRIVQLEGEGYFDVAHNPEKPFIVNAGEVQVKALGTAFNVHAYPEDGTISTSLIEGKVVLEKEFDSNQTRVIGEMVPGQHVTFHTSSGKITSSKEDLYKYIAWKDGKMVFDNEPISGVAAALSRKYNVDIQLADDVKQYTYTVTFFNDPLFLILDLMAETTPITYNALPRRKLPDGSYSKLRIVIKKRE